MAFEITEIRDLGKSIPWVTLLLMEIKYFIRSKLIVGIWDSLL